MDDFNLRRTDVIKSIPTPSVGGSAASCYRRLIVARCAGFVCGVSALWQLHAVRTGSGVMHIDTKNNNLVVIKQRPYEHLRSHTAGERKYICLPLQPIEMYLFCAGRRARCNQPNVQSDIIMRNVTSLRLRLQWHTRTHTHAYIFTRLAPQHACKLVTVGGGERSCAENAHIHTHTQKVVRTISPPTFFPFKCRAIRTEQRRRPTTTTCQECEYTVLYRVTCRVTHTCSSWRASASACNYVVRVYRTKPHWVSVTNYHVD